MPYVALGYAPEHRLDAAWEALLKQLQDERGLGSETFVLDRHRPLIEAALATPPDTDPLEHDYQEPAMWAYQFAGALTVSYDFKDGDMTPLLDVLSALAEGSPPKVEWPAVVPSTRLAPDTDPSGLRGCAECGLVGAHNPRCTSQWNADPSGLGDVEAAWEAALTEIRERIGGMDAVSVEWAPAHSAPYVSQLILAPIIEAVLARHRPIIEAAIRASDTPGLDVERLAAALAVIDSTRKSGEYPHIGPNKRAVARHIAAAYAALSPSPKPDKGSCARCGQVRLLSPDGTCWSCAVEYRDEIINEQRAIQAAAYAKDTPGLRERNHARAVASEDASGGYREIAGCGCEDCTALSPSPTNSWNYGPYDR